MTKELEALTRCRALICVKCTIEEINKNQKDYELIQNSLKAQEIVKTKRVDIAHLQDSRDCAEYNEVVKKLATLWRVLPLTEEEYNLLRKFYANS